MVIDLRNPSEVIDDYWIIAINETENPLGRSERSGKWLVFVPIDQVDEAWAMIRVATEKGVLGQASKVSTARPNPNATNPSTKVICVYTYDHEDESDVMRVREELRRLGFVSKMPYKTDEATHAGQYRVRGDKAISKYYC